MLETVISSERYSVIFALINDEGSLTPTRRLDFGELVYVLRSAQFHDLHDMRFPLYPTRRVRGITRLQKEPVKFELDGILKFDLVDSWMQTLPTTTSPQV